MRESSYDSLWPQSLEGIPEWLPQTRSLAVVSPHPDEETLGAGGLIYMCAELGYEITIVMVTDGEAARPEEPRAADRRIGELRSALMRIAPDGAHVVRLRFPDGKVAQSEPELVKRLLTVIPLDCTLVAPYELDGHSDNAATSRACQVAAKKLDVPCVRYPIWAWPRMAAQDLDTRSMRRIALTRSAQQAKHDAIHCFQSQIEERQGGAIVPHDVLSCFEQPYEVVLL